jgi:hypothetical protein
MVYNTQNYWVFWTVFTVCYSKKKLENTKFRKPDDSVVKTETNLHSETSCSLDLRILNGGHSLKFSNSECKICTFLITSYK